MVTTRHGKKYRPNQTHNMMQMLSHLIPTPPLSGEFADLIADASCAYCTHQHIALIGCDCQETCDCGRTKLRCICDPDEASEMHYAVVAGCSPDSLAMWRSEQDQRAADAYLAAWNDELGRRTHKLTGHGIGRELAAKLAHYSMTFEMEAPSSELDHHTSA